MNKFLKLAVIPIAFLVAGTSTSCSVSPKEIALITDVGDIDDGSFNQESWEACKEYAIENHKSYDFYRPFNDSDFARNCAVKQAVAKGAKVIVLPGFKFAPTCAAVMGKYPDVNFLLIDSYVHNGNYVAIDPTPNACCIGFRCEYSGFIAGYTIAQDLMTRDLKETNSLLPQYGYGYAGGMATSGVYEFGFGFIQGVIKATADFCKSHKIAEANYPTVRVNYTYAGAFAQHDPTTAAVKGWFTNENDGIKVVFPCGGKLYQSVTEAAQYYNKHQTHFDYNAWLKSDDETEFPRLAARWVGVDSDQYRGLKYDYEKKSIYTSALKGLNPAIINALKFHYAGEWSRIGGVHTADERGKVSGGGEIAYGNKWVLGLNSVFGEFETEEEGKAYAGDYVGIPVACNEQTGVMRGFDNFVYDDGSGEEGEHKDDFIGLYKRLAGGEIKVYDGDGTDWTWDTTIVSGYPDGMQDWYKTKNLNDDDKIYFRDEYLGGYKNIVPIKTI